ncbi:MAG: hypothetical protein ACYTGZ_15265 [Planctomycetota bacterium]|jgi:hypothetical protein
MTSPRRHPRRWTAAALCLAFLWCAASWADDELASEWEAAPESWIQEDIEAGFAKAKATGKPLLVAFR